MIYLKTKTKKIKSSPFSNQSKKKKPSFLTNITAVISLSVEIPD